jgi:hypothetical protein
LSPPHEVPQLQQPMPYEPLIPPLSLLSTMTLSSYIPCARSVALRLPIPSSNAESIPA